MARWDNISTMLRARKPSVALAATGLCVGLTNLWLRGGQLGGLLDFLAVWLLGCFGTVFVLLLAYSLAAWSLGDKAPDMDGSIIVACATLISVCVWLLIVQAGPWGGDDYDWSGYDPY